jgi:phosphonate transport system substrate-binding protein
MTSRIVFGMVPQRDDEKTRVLLNDLCACLGKHLAQAVVPHRSPSAEALASALHSGRVQVAWTGALLMLLSEHMAEMAPILSSVREGVAFYHSVLFVPSESPIRDLAGAKGKRVAWVAPSSASGYVVPRLSLARSGIRVNEFFSQEIFAGSHAAATRAAMTGQADLAGTYAVFEGGDPKKELVKSGFRNFDPELKVRVLDVSGPIPSDLIVATPQVTLAVRRAISLALLRIAADPTSKAIMADLIGADGFTPFTPAVLREVRALVAVARDAGALPGRVG